MKAKVLRAACHNMVQPAAFRIPHGEASSGHNVHMSPVKLA